MEALLKYRNTRGLSRTNRNTDKSFSIDKDKTNARPPHTMIQPKLELTTPGDSYEQEADRMADFVMRKAFSGSSGIPTEHPSRTSALPPVISRQTDGVSSGIAIDSATENSINASRGGGQPLPDTLRTKMESGFGADFSGVRLHTGSQAADLSNTLQAKAFTHGNDIFFNSGQYNPQSATGQHLIAHELTHVMQQSGKVGRKKTPTSNSKTVHDFFEWGGCAYHFYSEIVDDKNTDFYLTIDTGKKRKKKNLEEYNDFYFTIFISEANDKKAISETHITSKTTYPIKVGTIPQTAGYNWSYKITPFSINAVRKHPINNTGSNLSDIRMPIGINSSSMSFEISQGFEGPISHKEGAVNTRAIDIVSRSPEESEIPVVAVGAGEVLRVVKGIEKGQKQPPEGNSVYILHTNKESPLYGYISIYLHLQNDKYLPVFGQTVVAGARVGTMGDTGASTGTHLHFSIVRFDLQSFEIQPSEWSLEGKDLGSMKHEKIKKKGGTVDNKGRTTWEHPRP